MAETREVYEQVEDETGRTRRDRPFTAEEAKELDARNRQRPHPPLRPLPLRHGAGGSVKAQQVVDALASGLTELLLDHVEVVRTPDHCDPLLGAEVEPGRIRGLDLGRNHRLHRPTSRFEKMSVWTEPSVRTLRRVGVGPPCGAGWATPRPRSRRR